MIARPRDVAKFFFHLLDNRTAHSDPKPLVSDASRKEMLNFQPLSVGWAHGVLWYGVGMMHLAYGHSQKFDVWGHEGDTYGFLSSQGYVPELKGSYSVASNIDNAIAMEGVMCYLLQIVATKIAGSTKDLGCYLTDVTFV